jgi:hypothetical protein
MLVVMTVDSTVVDLAAKKVVQLAEAMAALSAAWMAARWDR